MRIIFAGTPRAAVPTLRTLLASPHEVAAVLTRPPARSGRGRTLHPSPVAEAATGAGVPLIEASSVRDEEVRERISGVGADLGVVVAYGAIIPPDVLTTPRLGWINLHFSDLPRWRGAAPVQWAILAGDTRTASSVFQLEEGLDTGPVFSRLDVDVDHDTAGELLARMADLGAHQVLEVVDALGAGTAHAVPQDLGPDASRLIHARKLVAADGFVDFHDTAEEVDRRIRATTPDPGAWTTTPDGRRLKMEAVTAIEGTTSGPGVVVATKNEVTVGCGSGAVRLGRVAPAGKGWMDAAAWARGARLDEGAQLGTGSADTGEGSR